MSTVTLTIGPKSYTIACADGEEAHVSALGAMIADKYAQLGQSRAPLEAQNLLFAALFLADELAEARKRIAAAPKPEPAARPETDAGETEALRKTIARLQSELAAARKATPPAPPPPPQFDLFGGPPASAAASNAIAERLEALAARAEASAAALEAAAASA